MTSRGSRADSSPSPVDRGPARVVVLLLLAEAALLAAIGLGLGAFSWLAPPGLAAPPPATNLPGRLAEGLAARGLLLPLAILALAAVPGTLRLRPGAWLVAMGVQSLVLVAGLVVRWRVHAPHGDVLLAAGVVLVLTLNSRPVRRLYDGNGSVGRIEADAEASPEGERDG